MNASVGEKQCNAFRETFEQNLQAAGVPDYFLKHLLKKLSAVYEQGIMDAEDYARLQADETRSIRIYQQNEASTHSLKNILTSISVPSVIAFLSSCSSSSPCTCTQALCS
jgi:hypothetical protein